MFTVDQSTLGPLECTVLQPAEPATHALRASAPRFDHCCAGRLLRDQELDCNFLWRLSEGEQRQFRRTVMDMVLATDMKQHFALVAKFRLLVTHGHRASQSSEAHMAYNRGCCNFRGLDCPLGHLNPCCTHAMGCALGFILIRVEAAAGCRPAACAAEVGGLAGWAGGPEHPPALHVSPGACACQHQVHT